MNRGKREAAILQFLDGSQQEYTARLIAEQVLGRGFKAANIAPTLNSMVERGLLNRRVLPKLTVYSLHRGKGVEAKTVTVPWRNEKGEELGTWTNVYGMPECPAYRAQIHGDKATPDTLPIWSGTGKNFVPPPVHTVTEARINNIGRVEVLGYFVEYGYLGVHVLPLDPPAWYVKQNGIGAAGHLFGAEIEK